MEIALLKSQLAYYYHQVIQLIGLKVLGVLLVAALAPHFLTLHVLLLLYLIDFVTGVLVARQMKRFSSAGMRRGIAKLFIYVLFITVIAMSEHAVLGTKAGTLAAIGLLVATELVSIVENLVWLGLPIPYAAKVLSVVSSKAKNFGLKTAVDDSDVALAYTKDMYELMNHNVDHVKDAPLRECLQVYCSGWYTFLRDLDPVIFNGTPELGWARLKATVDRTLVDIQSAMSRSRVSLKNQNTFLKVWNGDLLARLYKTSKQTSLAKDLPADQRIEQIRDQTMLMIYRLVNEAEKLDQAGPTPLDLHGDTTLDGDSSEVLPAQDIQRPDGH